MLTAASAIFVNISYIKLIKNRTQALREVFLMIDYIEICIKFQNLDMKEIFKSVSSSEKYPLLPFINDFEKMNFNLDFSEYTFNSAKVRNLFSPYSCELLKGYFSMLGKSDTDGQILNCQTYKGFFKQEIEKAQESEERKIKTGSSLIFGVMFLFLIIIL